MTRLGRLLSEFRHDTRGSALVELSIVMPLLLLMLFGILDYGRLYWIETSLQKAMQIASRTASVRPPVCPGVPATYAAAAVPSGETAPRFGTLCRSGSVCADPGTRICDLTVASTTSDEIWDRIVALLPPGATRANVRLSYAFDDRLGFLGGPYTPVVSAEFADLDFRFVLPIGQLAALAANDASITAKSPTTISLPTMSTSVPAEDLASGTDS